ncbi:unnamed protein product [Vitrella brassicaformis CCMP3155]|uniref:Myeloid leukemia factor n=2 Tax=Vitrella brassicaformis TaxID=1169539 RepID=A0A0G4H3V4_VITBC|nr:unnamed protein product [Vitrella brassicaformis CCMP3155]|eukprot:CEM38380.1 unnamed protein product [Vitrella brassicaformis CCMP3155]
MAAAMHEMDRDMMPFDSFFPRGERSGMMGMMGGFPSFDSLMPRFGSVMGRMGDGIEGMMAHQGGGGGFYSSQVMMMKQSTGQDGQVHTEKYAQSTMGDHQEGLRETQQAYTNSSTGVDKMALERHLRERGRKVIKERNRHSGQERETDLYKGMTEHQAPQFDADFEARRRHSLPQRHGHSLEHAWYQGNQSLPSYPNTATNTQLRDQDTRRYRREREEQHEPRMPRVMDLDEYGGGGAGDEEQEALPPPPLPRGRRERITSHGQSSGSRRSYGRTGSGREGRTYHQ